MANEDLKKFVGGTDDCVARDAVGGDAYWKSPKKFIPPQLLAYLIVKEFLRLYYHSVTFYRWNGLTHKKPLTVYATFHYTVRNQ